MAYVDQEDQQAIDTGEDYTPSQEQVPTPQPRPSGAPGAGMPDMGPPPAMQEMAQDSMRTGVGKLASNIGGAMSQGVENVSQSAPVRGVKRMIGLLMGEGGDPAAVQHAGAQVDPRGELDPNIRNVLAVDQAAEQGGEQAAWKLVQSNRVAYNAKQAFGYAALNGNQQKPPDLNAAIDAANKAGEHVLDGSSVQFQPTQGGVTATVKMAGTDQPQQINLSLDQFRQYLNVGGAGQWDRLMQTTVPATLQRLSQSNAGKGVQRLGQNPPPQQQPTQAPQANDEPVASPKTNFGKTPSSMNLSGDDNVQEPQPTAVEQRNYGGEREARARSMYPHASQEQERNQFMSADLARQEKMDNEIAVAEQKGTNAKEVAEIAGRWRDQTADTTGKHKEAGWQYATDAKLKLGLQQIAQKIRQQESTNANAAQTRELKVIQTLMLAGKPLSPDQQKVMDQMPGAAQAAAEVTKPGAQAPQQQQAAPQQQQQQVTPAQRQKAEAWLKANPDDPMAAAVKQKLGIQ